MFSEEQLDNDILSEEDTPKAHRVRQKCINSDIQSRTWFLEGETGIYFRLVEINGRVKLVLEIGDNTTNQGIRDIAPLALEYRDLIEDCQLAEIALDLVKRIQHPNSKNELLTHLALRQQNGESYAKLAKFINDNFSKCLYIFSKYQQTRARTIDDLIEENQHRNLFVLLSGTFYSEDLFTILKEGVENINSGNPPFEEGYPVSREKMIEVLRTWRKSKYYLAIQEKLSKTKKMKEV